MKIKLTFDLTDLQRKAIGKAAKCKKPATRTQAAQFIVGEVVAGLCAAVAEYETSLYRDDHPGQLPLFAADDRPSVDDV